MSDYFHQDLLVLILKWMPVKTLLQWRSVCKPWKQLIDSEPFILEHLAVQRSRTILQNQRWGLLDPCNPPSYDILTGPEGVNAIHFSVLCSVNGVICLSDTTKFLLWNPSIRQSVKIPFPYDPDHELSDSDFLYCGFWIDAPTNDFKIVSLNFEKKRIYLFSSVTDTWTKIAIVEELGSDDENSVLIDAQNSVIIDEVAHWIADIDMVHAVVFFDFRQDKIGKMELPKLPANWSPQSWDAKWVGDKNICKWNGLLSLVQWYDEPCKCDLWVMQSGCWSKMSSFSLTSVVREVIHVWEAWGRVLAATAGELVVYDPQHGCIPLDLDLKKYPSSFVVDFVESFVFPHRKCNSGG